MSAPRDVLYHYPLNEANPANPFNDAGPLALNIVNTNGSPPCPHPCSALGQTGRSPANSVVPNDLCANPAVQTNQLGSSFAAYGWAAPSNIAGAGGVVSHYGGDGSGAPALANSPIYLRVIMSGGELTAEWQHAPIIGPFQLISNQTTTMSIADNDEFFWAVSVCEEYAPGIVGTFNLRVRLEITVYNATQNYIRTESFSDLPDPFLGSGLTAGVQVCLFRDIPTSTLTGCFADMGWMTDCVSENWVRLRAAECERCFAEERLIQTDDNGCFPFPKVCARVQVRRECNQPWVNLSEIPGAPCVDFFISASWTKIETSRVSTATIELAREVYGYSLSPFVSNQINTDPDTGFFRRLLDAKRQIKIETAIVVPNIPASEWQWNEEWTGFIDDVDWSRPTIQIQASDQSTEMRDVSLTHRIVFDGAGVIPPPIGVPTDEQYYYEETALTPGPLEDVLQRIIDLTQLQLNRQILNPNPPLLFQGCVRPVIWDKLGITTQASDFYTEKCVSLLEELNRIANAAGLDLRYLYDEQTGRFRPALFRRGEANQAPGGSVHTFKPTDIHTWTEAKLSAENIRTFISVFYGPEAAGSPNALGDPFRANPPEVCPDPLGATFPLIDLPRIREYGLNEAKIEEDSARSPVQTAPEALDLANAAWDVLGRPFFFGTFEHPYFPHPELGDRVTIEGAGKVLDNGGSIQARITEVTHQIGNGVIKSRFSVQQLIP